MADYGGDLEANLLNESFRVSVALFHESQEEEEGGKKRVKFLPKNGLATYLT